MTDRGDVMGSLSKLPTETVYTAQEAAARVMLAALEGLMGYVGGWDSPSGHPCAIAIAAIAQAKAAGIKEVQS